MQEQEQGLDLTLPTADTDEALVEGAVTRFLECIDPGLRARIARLLPDIGKLCILLSAPNPRTQTPDPKPQTPNPKPQTQPRQTPRKNSIPSHPPPSPTPFKPLIVDRGTASMREFADISPPLRVSECLRRRSNNALVYLAIGVCFSS